MHTSYSVLGICQAFGGGGGGGDEEEEEEFFSHNSVHA